MLPNGFTEAGNPATKLVTSADVALQRGQDITGTRLTIESTGHTMSSRTVVQCGGTTSPSERPDAERRPPATVMAGGRPGHGEGSAAW